MEYSFNDEPIIINGRIYKGKFNEETGKFEGKKNDRNISLINFLSELKLHANTNFIPEIYEKIDRKTNEIRYYERIGGKEKEIKESYYYGKKETIGDINKIMKRLIKYNNVKEGQTIPKSEMEKESKLMFTRVKKLEKEHFKEELFDAIDNERKLKKGFRKAKDGKIIIRKDLKSFEGMKYLSDLQKETTKEMKKMDRKSKEYAKYKNRQTTIGWFRVTIAQILSDSLDIEFDDSELSDLL